MIMLELLPLEQSGCSLQILALPAKRVGFFAVDGALIARSDSNGEDLEAFAGAGKPYLQETSAFCVHNPAVISLAACTPCSCLGFLLAQRMHTEGGQDTVLKPFSPVALQVVCNGMSTAVSASWNHSSWNEQM